MKNSNLKVSELPNETEILLQTHEPGGNTYYKCTVYKTEFETYVIDESMMPTDVDQDETDFYIVGEKLPEFEDAAVNYGLLKQMQFEKTILDAYYYVRDNINWILV